LQYNLQTLGDEVTTLFNTMTLQILVSGFLAATGSAAQSSVAPVSNCGTCHQKESKTQPSTPMGQAAGPTYQLSLAPNCVVLAALPEFRSERMP